MYTNFIYFLGAIFIFSLKADAGVTDNFALSLLIYLSSLQLFRIFCRRRLQKLAGSTFQQRSSQLLMLSLPFYWLALYLSGIGNVLAKIPIFTQLSSLSDLCGIVLYLMYWQSLWWEEGRIWGMNQRQRVRYIFNSLQSALPIIVPWLLFAIILDGVAALTGIGEFLATGWGEFCSWLFFIALMFLVFPPLLVRLWGCTALPAGELRQHLVTLGKSQNFRAKYCLWPFQGGRAYTAAVVGFLPWIRYVLFTPALLRVMDQEEVDAIMLHEVGHVKHRHIVLFLYIIGGFSLAAYWYAEALQLWILSLEPVMILTLSGTVSVETMTSLSGDLPIFLALIIYFRFFFGFFLRNFERQADFYAVVAQKTAAPLISSFEKLARYSGTKRSEKSWHHFGLGERINALMQAERDRKTIDRHNRKLYFSIMLYTLLLLAGFMGTLSLDIPSQQQYYRMAYAEKAIFYHAEHERENPLWQQLKGEVYLQRGEKVRALQLWEEILPKMSKDANLLNNIAWLLLTVDDEQLRDPQRARDLAQQAAFIEQKSFIFDTLATAYWAMGEVALAVQTERYAISLDPQRQHFYLQQIKLFQTKSYNEWLQGGGDEISQ